MEIKEERTTGAGWASTEYRKRGTACRGSSPRHSRRSCLPGTSQRVVSPSARRDAQSFRSPCQKKLVCTSSLLSPVHSKSISSLTPLCAGKLVSSRPCSRDSRVGTHHRDEGRDDSDGSNGTHARRDSAVQQAVSRGEARSSALFGEEKDELVVLDDGGDIVVHCIGSRSAPSLG